MEHRKDLVNTKEVKQIANPAFHALIVSEERYRRLFETALDGILIIDADSGHITDVNPILMEMLGYAHKEFIGRALWRFGAFKDIQKTKSTFQKLLRNGHIRYERLPLETKDGRSVEVEFVGNIYRVGQKRTIQCNIRDISQRKAYEKSRSKIRFQLKQAQKMAAVAALAGGMAHQFNNALTVITGGLNLLETNGIDRQGNEYLQLMTKAAGRMSRLTLELLAYARGGKYSIETILLSDLVRESLPLHKAIFKPSITVETEIPPDLPPIQADKDQIHMALQAILNNASEAIETQGRIRIICSKEVMTDDSAKSFSGLAPGIYACLAVEDNGRGMAEETRNRVFEPFFTTRFPGRGLGMAAVYGIVKNHGGWVSVDSQLGMGTIVKLRLPVNLASDANERQKQKIRRIRASGTK
jgi:PAS domain S-box-containing protein